MFLFAADVPMIGQDGVVGDLAQGRRDAVDHRHRAMLSAGATDTDDELMTPFSLIHGDGVFQQRHDAVEIFDRVG